MSKSKYPCVYKDKKGNIYYQVELGVNKNTGKRIQKMGRKDDQGKPFKTFKQCHDYVISLKNKYAESKGIFANGIALNYFINKYYVPHYK